MTNNRQAQFTLLTPDFIIHPSSQTLSTTLPLPTSNPVNNKIVQTSRSARTSIFSIDIHPHNNRVVTGGNDHYVRLWSLNSIIDESAFKDLSNPKELFAAKRHDGGIMCVRWACTGILLASGADDGSLVIWQLSLSPCTIPGLLVGARDPVTYPESLTFIKKLPSMASDVIDLAWSTDNRYLATCSLDNTVIVFDGGSFDCIARCQHSSFVKGLAFDPVGMFLVSQSDDGSAVFWNTTTWKQEVKVSHAFIQDTGSAAVFVRRPSFAPDGSFVACANAVSNGVHVAALFPRNRWTYPTKTIYLVGHTAPVCVAKFSPIMVSVSPTSRPSPILALGSNDRRISLWILCAHAVLILDSVFESDVTDLTWSKDGRTLLASSHQGKVAGIHIGPDLDLFGGNPPVPQSVIDHRLDKSGRLPALARAVNQARNSATTQIMLKGSTTTPAANTVATTPTTTLAVKRKPLTDQKVSTTKDGRKRIQPALVSAFNSPKLSFSTSNPINPAFLTDPVHADSTHALSSQFDLGNDQSLKHVSPNRSMSSAAMSVDSDLDIRQIPVRPPIRTKLHSHFSSNQNHVGTSNHTQHDLSRVKHILPPLSVNTGTGILKVTKNELEVHATQTKDPVTISVLIKSSSDPIMSHLVLDSPVHTWLLDCGHMALVTCRGTFMILDLWLNRVTVRHSAVHLIGSATYIDLYHSISGNLGMPVVRVGSMCFKFDAALDCFVFLESG